MAEITPLIRQRGSVKAKLTSFISFLRPIRDEFESEGVLTEQRGAELRLKFDKTEPILADFDRIQDQIELACDEGQLNDQYAERDNFTSLYLKHVVEAKLILEKICPEVETGSIHSGASDAPSNNYVNSSTIKLPTIQLPTFKGDYNAWLEFKDTFESLIHSNVTITQVQKYHYLRSSLDGDAKKVIQSLEFSSENYTIAWELLCNRYNNARLLVHNHVKSLFNMEVMSKESASGLHNLIDTVFKHLRALSVLKQPTQHWDTLIIFILSTKLDKITAREWEKHKSVNELPTLAEMQSFLQSRADFLETLETNYSSKYHKEKDSRNGARQLAFTSTERKCNFCKGSHLIYYCEEFKKLDVSARLNKVNNLKLCTNCLLSGHTSTNCRLGPCKTCKQKHNSLLHREVPHTSSAKAFIEKNETNYVVLSTASLVVSDKEGNTHKIRALLDSGSQSNFISEELCKRLNLQKTSSNLTVVGINNRLSNLNSMCELTIHSLYNNFTTTLSCFILPNIIGSVPSYTIDIEKWNIPTDINLADPTFNQSGQIDVLIGAGLFWHLILNEKISLGKGLPILQNTSLGYVVSGAIGQSDRDNKSHCYLAVNDSDLQNNLKQFWEIEECGHSSQSLGDDDDDKECEAHFAKTVTRNEQGRFVVRIPLKHSPDKLGNSKIVAMKRLVHLERKLAKSDELKQQYVSFMNEYATLKHMSLLTTLDESRIHYFLPHHGVIRKESLTTKLRVVFDGSATTTSGWSMNQLQFTGPAIQNDIFSILVRFREHSIVVSADIAKMYRQILIHPDDRWLQNILWRDDSSKAINIYQLNTVTYGTSSAPYLAIRCLRQLGYEYQQQFPVACNIIQRDFYVDDLMTGFKTEKEAMRLCQEITSILSKAGFNLRKWVSNNKSILSNLQDESEPVSVLKLGDQEKVKTLGLQWVSQLDIITYHIKHFEKYEYYTKRNILSDIAKIYDPLGLISPCIIITKILIQKLWSLKLNWDEEIPADLTKSWELFRNTLSVLNNLQISRHAVCNDAAIVELHGFCDASKTAYGACVYLKSIKNNKVQVTLLCAKTKVAPLKPLTIPRLELCSALMLSKLVNNVLNSLTIKPKCHLWADSQIALCWIQTQPNKLQTFVCNRVNEIQSLTSVENWNYVNTKENPADLASRGLTADALLKSTLWWKGPSWLSSATSEYPQSLNSINSCQIPELKPEKTLLVKTDCTFLFNKYSSLGKLKRVVAYCFRFTENSKQNGTKQRGELTPQEQDLAMKRLVKLSQMETFSKEIKLLQSSTPLSSKHSLRGLSPFVDSDGLLRVGGRLSNANVTHDVKHPLLLCGQHKLTRLIIENEHKRLLHAGPQMLLFSVRQSYWPTSGMRVAKTVVRQCVRCFKYNPKGITPIMANLPKERVNAMSPFYVTGVDYAGAFSLKDRKGRGSKIFKGYICLFICFSSKAVHLELVTDLTSEAFILALRRFSARRGKPCQIFSDNGTNFVGAQRELNILHDFLKNSNDEIVKACASENITWRFIPANSPHFGGLWESGVKSAKHHLVRVMGKTPLTYEEFNTILIQIEATLNSRPLYPLSSDPNDLQPLTPSHFLIGKPLTTLPDPNVKNIPLNKLSRHQLLQQITQGFWARWSKEYLNNLQQPNKWTDNLRQLERDTLVLIKHDNLPSCNWLLGRVVELHKGPDDIVRVVTLKTKNGLLKRAVAKLCPLPLPSQNSESVK